jgi:hypothetical protein
MPIAAQVFARDSQARAALMCPDWFTKGASPRIPQWETQIHHAVQTVRGLGAVS